MITNGCVNTLQLEAKKGLITDDRVTAAVTAGNERALTDRGITEAVTVVVKRVSTVGRVVVTSTIIQGEISSRRIQITAAAAIKRLRVVCGVLSSRIRLWRYREGTHRIHREVRRWWFNLDSSCQQRSA